MSTTARSPSAEDGADADCTISTSSETFLQDRERRAEPDRGVHVRQAEGQGRHGPGHEAPEALLALLTPRARRAARRRPPGRPRSTCTARTTASYGETTGVSIFIASSTTSGWRGLTDVALLRQHAQDRAGHRRGERALLAAAGVLLRGDVGVGRRRRRGRGEVETEAAGPGPLGNPQRRCRERRVLRQEGGRRARRLAARGGRRASAGTAGS